MQISQELTQDYPRSGQIVKQFSLVDIQISLTVVLSLLFFWAFFMPELRKGYYLCLFTRIDEYRLDWGEYFRAQKGKKNSNSVNLFC